MSRPESRTAQVEPGENGDGEDDPSSPAEGRAALSRGTSEFDRQQEEELQAIRDALSSVKTALLEMRTRSSLVSEDDEEVAAVLPVIAGSPAALLGAAPGPAAGLRASPSMPEPPPS